MISPLIHPFGYRWIVHNDISVFQLLESVQVALANWWIKTYTLWLQTLHEPHNIIKFNPPHKPTFSLKFLSDCCMTQVAEKWVPGSSQAHPEAKPSLAWILLKGTVDEETAFWALRPPLGSTCTSYTRAKYWSHLWALDLLEILPQWKKFGFHASDGQEKDGHTSDIWCHIHWYHRNPNWLAPKLPQPKL